MAGTKEMAKQVIDSLPADATLDDIVHALYIRAKCERADGRRGLRRGVFAPRDSATGNEGRGAETPRLQAEGTWRLPARQPDH